MYPELEKELKADIVAHRQKGWKVKSRWVKRRALELASKLLELPSKFKCSCNWRLKFRKRNNLTKR
jgi:hypothetical protein